MFCSPCYRFSTHIRCTHKEVLMLNMNRSPVDTKPWNWNAILYMDIPLGLSHIPSPCGALLCLYVFWHVTFFCISFFSFNAWIVFMYVSFSANLATAVASQENKEEADAWSVFVGNVRNTIFFLFELSLFQVCHSFRLVCWLCWVIWCVIMVFLLHNFKYSFLKCFVF